VVWCGWGGVLLLLLCKDRVVSADAWLAEAAMEGPDLSLLTDLLFLSASSPWTVYVVERIYVWFPPIANLVPVACIYACVCACLYVCMCVRNTSRSCSILSLNFASLWVAWFSLLGEAESS
jgi:hypothetical protein